MRGIAYVNDSRGRYDRAEPLYREVLEIQRRVLGPRHPETLDTLRLLGFMLTRAGRLEDAGRIGQEALQASREVLGDDDPRTVASLVNYANTLRVLRSPEAERYLRESCERCRTVLGPRDPLNTEALNGLAIFLNREGRLEEAETVYRDCARLSVAVYGEDHPQTLAVRTNLARFVTERAERPWEAERLLRGVLEGWRKQSADERAIAAANQLGELLITLGRAEEARTLLTQTLRDAEARFGAEHAQTAGTLADLGWASRVQGRRREAEGCYRRALEIRRKVLGPDHEYSLRVAAQLGWVVAEQGRRGEGERLAREAVERGEKVLPEGHPQMAAMLENVGRILLASGRPAEAEPHLRRALAIRRASHAIRVATAETEGVLARCLLREGNLKEAEDLLTRSWPVIARNRGAAYPLRDDALHDVRDLYERLGTPEQAAALLAAPALEQLVASR